MFIEPGKLKIYVRIGKTDMRKQINGLSIMVQDEFELNPFENSLFVFCNKPKNRLKILYWDRNGFCLWLLCKALHKSHYEKKNIMRRNINFIFNINKQYDFLFA